MSDQELDTANQDIDDNSNSGEGSNEAELTPMQQKAADKGWTPKDDFQGEEEEWVDANTYLKHGELMAKISSQSKMIKEQNKAITSIKKMKSGMEKVALEKARDQLLAEKAEAYENQDFVAAVNIDQKISAANEDIAVADEDEVDHGANFGEYFQDEWKPENKWYGEDEAVDAFADRIGVKIYNSDPSADPAEIMAEVSEKVKARFPKKFENPNRSKAGQVASGNNSGKSGGKTSVNKLVANLSEVERKIGKEQVRLNIFKNLGEYAEALKASEE